MNIHPPQAPYARHVRYRVRHQARLDAESSAKPEEPAAAFRRKRSAIPRYTMEWGLTHVEGWTLDPSIPETVHLIPLLLEPKRLGQVQDAAAADGAPLVGRPEGCVSADAVEPQLRDREDLDQMNHPCISLGEAQQPEGGL